MITVNQIFEANQILTFKEAKLLLGKKIATTSPEYWANKPHIEIFIITGFVSEWDDAREIEYPESDKYNNFQEYWKSYMNEMQIVNKQQSIMILDEKGTRKYRCDINKNMSFFPEPTFHGSDADRPVYYIKL